MQKSKSNLINLLGIINYRKILGFIKKGILKLIYCLARSYDMIFY